MPLTQAKALVVDDEDAIAIYIAQVLRARGHYALPLTDPADALEHAAVINFDVAFLGIAMPGMSGLDLGVRIRQLLPNCAVILGVESVPGVVERAKALGYDFDYLSAPFEIEDLLAKITA